MLNKHKEKKIRRRKLSCEKKVSVDFMPLCINVRTQNGIPHKIACATSGRNNFYLIYLQRNCFPFYGNHIPEFLLLV